MISIYEELSRRFPEIEADIKDDSELPYVMMASLATWLNTRASETLTADLVGRVVSFARWCEEQPRGQDAGDDLFTILAVGFYEKLFELENARALLPTLISRSDLVANEDYLTKWVGEDCYRKALALYDTNI